MNLIVCKLVSMFVYVSFKITKTRTKQDSSKTCPNSSNRNRYFTWNKNNTPILANNPDTWKCFFFHFCFSDHKNKDLYRFYFWSTHQLAAWPWSRYVLHYDRSGIINMLNACMQICAVQLGTWHNLEYEIS